MLGESIYITSEYLTQEAKITSSVSRLEALEVENSKLKKDLITTMDEANFIKEKVKYLGDDLRAERQLMLEKDEQLLAAREKLKVIAVKAVKGFQQTEEYSTVLFSWYFKGFELLRWYIIKHPIGVELENLDMEVVDQEMAADEVAQSTAPEATPGDTPMPSVEPEFCYLAPFFFHDLHPFKGSCHHLASSVTYIRLGGILLFSNFFFLFMTYTLLRDHAIFWLH